MNADSGRLQTTLRAPWYTDAACFAREAGAIFHREWFCAGRGEGLEAAGAFRTVSVAGESVMLVRGDDRQLRGFYNVCRHRGAQLVAAPTPAEQHGVFRGGIRCPYHSWNYRLDGALNATPHLDVCRESFALNAVDVDCWGGFVFVRLASGGASLAATLGDAVHRIRRYPLQQLQLGHRIEYQVRANWKVILENYNECYHCAGVHPELCRVVPAFRQAGGAGLDWERGVAHREGANTFTFSGTTARAPFPGLDDDEKTRHKGELFYPNLMLSLAMDHAAAFLLWPRSAALTEVRCDFLFHPEEIAKPGFDPSDTVEFWDLTNRQDWQICESVQRGMASRSFERGVCAPMEDLSLDIRNYIHQRIPESDDEHG